MFLVEIWNDITRPGPPDHRLSRGYEAFTHEWDFGLNEITQVSYGIKTVYGGVILPDFGTISFTPAVLLNDLISMDVYFTTSDEEHAQLLFSCTGFINNRTIIGATYDIYTDAPNVKIDNDLNYITGHTLMTVFQAYCTSAGWTLDSTLARTTDIAVSFTAKAGQMFADLLSDMCKTYSHYFVIDVLTKTIHLRDLVVGAGVAKVLTEFEYFPSMYNYDVPVARVDIDTAKQHYHHIYGSPYYFGDIVSLKSFHDTDQTINTALAQRVKDYAHAGVYRFQLHMPTDVMVDIGINFINGNVLEWHDSTIAFPQGQNKTIKMIMQNLSFDTTGEAIISGYTTWKI